LTASGSKALTGYYGADILIGLMGSGLSVGPLLIMLVDPINKKLAIVPIDLLTTIVTEARVTLLFACFLALTNPPTVSLLRSR
jgi:hypothetical protein